MDKVSDMLDGKTDSVPHPSTSNSIVPCCRWLQEAAPLLSPSKTWQSAQLTTNTRSGVDDGSSEACGPILLRTLCIMMQKPHPVGSHAPATHETVPSMLQRLDVQVMVD